LIGVDKVIGNAPVTYKINGKLITKEAWDASPKVGIIPGKPPMGIVRTSFVSPIDGTVISSAADLRAHEKKHNVIQAGNEYVGLVNEKREAAREVRHENKEKADYNFKWR